MREWGRSLRGLSAAISPKRLECRNPRPRRSQTRNPSGTPLSILAVLSYGILRAAAMGLHSNVLGQVLNYAEYQRTLSVPRLLACARSAFSCYFPSSANVDLSGSVDANNPPQLRQRIGKAFFHSQRSGD